MKFRRAQLIKRLYCLVAAFLVTATNISCSTLIGKIYGVRKPKYLRAEEIVKYANRFGPAKFDLGEIKPGYSAYLTFVENGHGWDSPAAIAPSQTAHNLRQPIQFMLYDRNRKLTCYAANCDAGGFPNLNWNRNGAFDEFPPKSLTKIDTSICYDSLIDNLYFLQGNPRGTDTHYTAFIFWNHFMHRQSKRLINWCFRNFIENSKTDSINIILVNNDNYFSLNP